MSSAGFLLLIAAAAVIVFAAVRLTRVYFRMRGQRVVTCPENRQKAGVEVNAGRAAASGLFAAPRLELSACSRWPEKQGCGQECLAQVAEQGDSCLVRNILTGWYAGKNCASCGKPIGHIDWATRHPALMTPERISIDWAQVRADHLDEVLATHQPVCFSCHVTNTFVRQHPDLVADRSARKV